jgi:hypothetical protein
VSGQVSDQASDQVSVRAWVRGSVLESAPGSDQALRLVSAPARLGREWDQVSGQRWERGSALESGPPRAPARPDRGTDRVRLSDRD